jgi:hypothetical protein
MCDTFHLLMATLHRTDIELAIVSHRPVLTSSIAVRSGIASTDRFVQFALKQRM